MADAVQPPVSGPRGLIKKLENAARSALPPGVSLAALPCAPLLRHCCPPPPDGATTVEAPPSPRADARRGDTPCGSTRVGRDVYELFHVATRPCAALRLSQGVLRPMTDTVHASRYIHSASTQGALGGPVQGVAVGIAAQGVPVRFSGPASFASFRDELSLSRPFVPAEPVPDGLILPHETSLWHLGANSLPPE